MVETYLSKAKILLYLENFTAAFLCLSDAVQIAKTKISEEKAESLVKEFEELLKEKAMPVITKTFSEKESGAEEKQEKLELILHPTIAHYQEFQGVWIKNSYLENFGLQKGSLAVVTKAELKRGDLVAINEIATNSVMCGFYDSDFGLVCSKASAKNRIYLTKTISKFSERSSASAKRIKISKAKYRSTR